MSKKIQRLWTSNEVEAALCEAYRFSFHEQMKGSYLCFTMMGKLDLVVETTWAKSIATAYMMSDIFAEYLQSFIAQSVPAFSSDEAKHALEGFRFKVPTITAKSYVSLQAAQDFLIKNLQSSKWLTLIVFAHSRGISVTASSQFDSNQWSEFSLFMMQLEGAFVRGDAKSLSRMLARDMKQYSVEFPSFIAGNMPFGLATMVGLDEKSAFFDFIDPVG